MRLSVTLTFACVLSAAPLVAQEGGRGLVPVSNNAVAAGRVGGDWWVFTALGVDSTRRWSGITRRAAAWSSATREWRALPDVPGDQGRLAATAQVVRGRWFIFGGYTVDSLGGERSLPSVDVFDPRTGRWSRGRDIPVPVDDAVSGVYRDSLVYLVSGWHDTDNVRDVQVYDAVLDAWSVGTPIPGPGVFGHSGELAGATIVYVDGAVRQSGDVKYRLHSQVWIGTINSARPTEIAWRAGPAHPGPSLYRAAVGRCGGRIIFAGGTGNPYNYNGIGYDGQPSSPLATVLAFETRTSRWQALPPMPVATMDHRALAVVGDTGWVVGGMRAGQRVSGTMVPVALSDCRS
ncbi:MAG: hypothetical protein IPF98_01925 [Gemmatimonadetes bacterium]|nr:hypothetical protein [Gemmatimonadota bacterium]MCC6771535.1 hypothetical protein [Gemmatimonadaceae bacterium]